MLEVLNKVDPVLFLTTPTSGTGSIWRMIVGLAGQRYASIKISEEYYKKQAFRELPAWRPDASSTIYMYNTPSIWDRNFELDLVRVIANFRDPRDLACNQFYWALQHPVLHKSPAEILAARKAVEDKGIDAYVLEVDNNPNFQPFFQLVEQVQRRGEDECLVVSYNQLCLDIDGMASRMARFFDVEDAGLVQKVVQPERVENLTSNPKWIGQQWTGSDTQPGRHRRELKPETVESLTKKYEKVLAVLRQLDRPEFASYYD